MRLFLLNPFEVRLHCRVPHCTVPTHWPFSSHPSALFESTKYLRLKSRRTRETHDCIEGHTIIRSNSELVSISLNCTCVHPPKYPYSSLPHDAFDCIHATVLTLVKTCLYNISFATTYSLFTTSTRRYRTNTGVPVTLLCTVVTVYHARRTARRPPPRQP